ncbi:MAG TPA: CAP domain-containing protein [Bryobacteraceae bacterium]|nr:CAP domain-containing protein [Bryobacteraceae bacterium]
MASCAREQSLRKAELRFAGHSDPERGDVADRLTSAGIRWGHCGENLFLEKGWDDPVNFAVVFWWYSTGHKENLLNPMYTQSGVGLAQGVDRAWFVTQIFVAPRPGQAGVGR